MLLLEDGLVGVDRRSSKSDMGGRSGQAVFHADLEAQTVLEIKEAYLYGRTAESYMLLRRPKEER